MLLGDSVLHFGRMLFPPAPSNHCHTINDFVGTASPSIHTQVPFCIRSHKAADTDTAHQQNVKITENT